MLQTVAVPVWLLSLIVVFAAVTFASHFLFPSVRWFFRKRAERAVARLNQRLAKPIEPFKLTRRYDTIQRLIYHPDITSAVLAEARDRGIPENVAFQTARRYAREIVPRFSAFVYFGLGIRIARWLSRSLYRIRVGAFDAQSYAAVDREAAVVFVMNHRSNMDYVLVTHLVSQTSALSYAVGEWARVWPLSALIRAMGAYFIRRRSRGQLYRRVLARYVQMALDGGDSQAMFPEGGLSLDGRLAQPKLGLLSYVVAGFDPARRDVIFVPVALNYDRVLEDRLLVAAGEAGTRRFRAPLPGIAKKVAHHLWTRLRGRFDGFGEAVVSFGAPLSLTGWQEGRDGDPTEPLSAELMARIAATMPVLPVPLVARAILDGARGAAIAPAVAELIGRAAARGAPVPDRDTATITAEAVQRLARRRLIAEDGTPAEGAEALLRFYANSIAHHLDPDAPPPAARAQPVRDAAPAKQ